MGVFSKLHRYRDAGQDANVNNVEKFGVPYLSLFTTTKVFTLHHHIDITDGNEQVVYQADSKMISLHDKTDLKTAAGEQVAHIERKLLSLHERHFITMSDGTEFQLSNELFHFIPLSCQELNFSRLIQRPRAGFGMKKTSSPSTVL